MASTKQTKVLKKIEMLRDRRLQLADLEVSRANAAVEQANRKVSAADQMLNRTDEFCRNEHRRLNDELASGAATGKDGLFAWRNAHEKLQERLKTAKDRLANAKVELQSEQSRLEQIKAKRRTDALAVERLKVLQAPVQRGN
ncbi:hypothetical protein [Noviherbaspirillum saxi]|uniref:Flagellar FliJ protein n=1 Tax=Noviherbaspirillum saxi TaxID=2320863 RepID=A0A3A3FYK5_9BURK|nr:hypothetical protein [Noviherbaspirillum saxi]RJF92169.1 hypothetical protein D3871_26365 [Noviherbaspirillum saxi]